MRGDEGDPLEMSTSSTVLGNTQTPAVTPFKKSGLQPIPSERLRSGVPYVGSEVGSPEPSAHMRMGMSSDAAQQVRVVPLPSHHVTFTPTYVTPCLLHGSGAAPTPLITHMNADLRPGERV